MHKRIYQEPDCTESIKFFIMNGSRGESGDNTGSTTNLSLQNKRLKEIRECYERSKYTPQQRRDERKKSGNSLIEMIRGNGADEATIAWMAQSIAAVDAMAAKVPDEDPRDKIVKQTFDYNDGNPNTPIQKITITSEGSRHWRKATVQDAGSIVYLPRDNKFGEFDDTGYETDEEFPDVKQTTAIVYTFSGERETPWADDDKFDDLLVVPDEVLQGVRNDAPPGRFFSGQQSKSGNEWNPAPEGKVWFQHPFLKEPNGMYLDDCSYYSVKRQIECPGLHPEIIEKQWREFGELAFWCPVLQRFITDGERYRLQHWFHNGDGSAQQRYYYDQNEMLDLHGGLDKLPTTISANKDNDKDSEIDQDQKMPAKKQRTK